MRGLNKAEGAVLRKIALSHGYVARSGRNASDGSPIRLILAINAGQVATVLLDAEERTAVILWLQEQAANAGRLEETICALASQLRAAAERAQALEDEDIQSAIEERR
jgi:hypothetical protein